jgi:hypothetical protein
MADERPPQSVDQFASTDPAADHDETNWGEDWESAFQAEDDAFFSEDKEEENFFLEENEPTATAGVGAPDLDASLEKTLSGIPDQGTAAGAKQAQPFTRFLAFPALFISAKIIAQTQFARLQALPIFVRIPLYALPLLVVGLFIVLISAQKPPPSLHQTATTSTEHPGSTMAPPDINTVGTSSPDAHEASQLHPGKVRKKWAFPAFVIPVKNPTGDQPAPPVTFVLVDITLITSLAEQEEPPADKKIFVRDIIYQFFQNKPLEELRRYSLARGEMNKELRAWLQKQWPEAPIESIIFNQYHLS